MPLHEGAPARLWNRGLVAALILNGVEIPRDELQRTPEIGLTEFTPAPDTAVEDLRRGIDAQERDGVSPDRVAAAVERALTGSRPRYRYVVGNDAKAAGLLERFLPDRTMAYVTRRLGP